MMPAIHDSRNGAGRAACAGLHAGGCGRARRGRGFTLMEVLMAILILSIVVPSLMQAYTICGNIASLSRQRAEALAIAQSTLDELVATAEWRNGMPSGEEKPGPTVYVWQAALSAFDEANTQLLTVTVSWSTSGGQRQEVKLDTVVYTPDETTTPTTPAVPQ